jgi:hypothetical protein
MPLLGEMDGAEGLLRADAVAEIPPLRSFLAAVGMPLGSSAVSLF